MPPELNMLVEEYNQMYRFKIIKMLFAKVWKIPEIWHNGDRTVYSMRPSIFYRWEYNYITGSRRFAMWATGQMFGPTVVFEYP